MVNESISSEFYDVLCKSCGEKYKANYRVFNLRSLIEKYIKMSSKQISPNQSAYEELNAVFEQLKDRSDHGLNLFRWGIRFINNEMKSDIGELQSDGDCHYRLNIKGNHFIQHLMTKLKLDGEADRSKIKELLKPIFNEEVDDLNELCEVIFKYRELCFLDIEFEISFDRDDQKKLIPSYLNVHYRHEVAELVLLYNEIAEKFEELCCPNCFKKISKNSGKYKEYVIGFIGTSGVGKSAYLAALIDILSLNSVIKGGNGRGGIGTSPKIILTGEGEDFGDESFKTFFNNYLKEYKEKLSVPKTDKEEKKVKPLSVFCQVPDYKESSSFKKVILTFVDMPGEIFLSNTDKDKIEKNYTAFNRADIYWLFIDPTQASSVIRDRTIQELEDQRNRNLKRTDEIITNLKYLEMLKEALKDTRRFPNKDTKRFSNKEAELQEKAVFPLGAVFLTKFDLFSNPNDTVLNDYIQQNGGISIDRYTHNIDSIYSNNSFNLDCFRDAFVSDTNSVLSSKYGDQNLIDEVTINGIKELFSYSPIFPVAAYGASPNIPAIKYSFKYKENGKIDLKSQNGVLYIQYNQDKMDKSFKDYIDNVFSSAIDEKRIIETESKLDAIKADLTKVEAQTDLLKANVQNELLIRCQSLNNEITQYIEADIKLISSLRELFKQKDGETLFEDYNLKDGESSFWRINELKAAENELNNFSGIEDALKITEKLKGIMNAVSQRVLSAYALAYLADKERGRDITISSFSIEGNTTSGIDQWQPFGIEIPFLWTMYALGVIQGNREVITEVKTLFGKREKSEVVTNRFNLAKELELCKNEDSLLKEWELNRS